MGSAPTLGSFKETSMKIGTLRLPRIAAHPAHGTFGSLVLQGMPICNTLEPYHRDNTTSISCVPTGQYRCVRHLSPSRGWVWIVTQVQGRSYILIHWGNVDDDTEGCIITGEKFGMLGVKWAVLESKLAFKEFMKRTEEFDELLLTITEHF